MWSSKSSSVAAAVLAVGCLSGAAGESAATPPIREPRPLFVLFVPDALTKPDATEEPDAGARLDRELDALEAASKRLDAKIETLDKRKKNGGT